MGRKSSQEISIIRDLVKKIILDLKIESPARIMEVLNNEYNKKVSKPVLLKMVREIKNANLPQIVPENLELEYENHPEIIAINNRIKVLLEDFRTANTVAERCKISNQIDSAQETKLKLKKILKETEAVAERNVKIQYVVYFDGPTVAEKEKDKNGNKKEDVEKNTQENKQT